MRRIGSELKFRLQTGNTADVNSSKHAIKDKLYSNSHLASIVPRTQTRGNSPSCCHRGAAIKKKIHNLCSISHLLTAFDQHHSSLRRGLVNIMSDNDIALIARLRAQISALEARGAASAITTPTLKQQAPSPPSAAETRFATHTTTTSAPKQQTPTPVARANVATHTTDTSAPKQQTAAPLARANGALSLFLDMDEESDAANAPTTTPEQRPSAPIARVSGAPFLPSPAGRSSQAPWPISSTPASIESAHASDNHTSSQPREEETQYAQSGRMVSPAVVDKYAGPRVTNMDRNVHSSVNNAPETFVRNIFRINLSGRKVPGDDGTFRDIRQRMHAKWVRWGELSANDMNTLIDAYNKWIEIRRKHQETLQNAKYRLVDWDITNRPDSEATPFGASTSSTSPSKPNNPKKRTREYVSEDDGDTGTSPPVAKKTSPNPLARSAMLPRSAITSSNHSLDEEPVASSQSIVDPPLREKRTKIRGSGNPVLGSVKYTLADAIKSLDESIQSAKNLRLQLIAAQTAMAPY